MRKHPTEKQIQNQILEYLNMIPGCKAWTNQSQGVFDQRTKRFRRQTGFHNRGVADIIGIYKGKMLCIEVKSKTGKLMDHQNEFLILMNKLGAISFMARSIDDVVNGLIGHEMLSASSVERVKPSNAC